MVGLLFSSHVLSSTDLPSSVHVSFTMTVSPFMYALASPYTNSFNPSESMQVSAAGDPSIHAPSWHISPLGQAIASK